MSFIYYPQCSILSIKKDYDMQTSICFIEKDDVNIIFNISENIVDQIIYQDKINAIIGDRAKPNYISVLIDTQQIYKLSDNDKHHAKYEAASFLTKSFYVAMAIGQPNSVCEAFSFLVYDNLEMYKKALSMAMLDNELPQISKNNHKRKKI